MNVKHIVRYEARITNPSGQPSQSDGPPDGQGPPEDAAPSDVVANVLSKTPTREDTRLHGVETDENGNPQGSPPREYGVEDRIEDETGDRVPRGTLPAASATDAEAIREDIKAEVTGADEYEVRHYKSPLGGVTRSEVETWYENHPDEQPTDDEGEAYIPSAFDSGRHVVDETSG